MKKIFFSYARSNKEARSLAEKLDFRFKDNNEVAFFYDEKLNNGDLIGVSIAHELKNSNILVVNICKDFLDSENCKLEINEYLVNRRDGRMIIFIKYFHDEDIFSRGRKFIIFRDNDDFIENVNKLINKKINLEPIVNRKITNVSLDNFEHADKYFSEIATVRNKKSSEKHSSIFYLVINSIKDFFSNHKSANKILIQGKIGSGKSLFLDFIYLKILENFKTIYIDDFVKIDNQEYDLYLENHLDLIRNSIIIWRTKIIKNSYQRIIQKISENSNFLIVSFDTDNSINQKSDQSFFEKIFDIHLELSDFLIGENETGFIVHSALQSTGSRVNIPEDKWGDLLKNITIKKIDLHTIQMINDYPEFEVDRIGVVKNYLVRKTSSDYEFNKQTAISIGRIYFKKFISSSQLEFEYNEEHYQIMTSSHSSIKFYCFSEFFVNYLYFFNEENNSDESPINYVFNFEINSFIKLILNSEKYDYSRLYKNILFIYENENTNLIGKTNLMYLLGRLNKPSLIKNSIEYLKSEKIRLAKKKLKSSDTLNFELCKRTIFISLAYLNDKHAVEEYLKELNNLKFSNTFNRGFHEEYYGDVPSLPSKYNHGLTRIDSLKIYPVLTLHILRVKIKKEFEKSGELSPMICIDCYTYLSIVQNRIMEKEIYLSDDDKSFFFQILNDSRFLNHLRQFRIIELDLYLDFLRSIFIEEGFKRYDQIFSMLYKIKNQVRKGWEERSIYNPEKVSSHLYGCLLLADLFLPESITNEKKYSKSKVLEILKHHDLVEAKYGDISSHNKTKKDIDNERKFFETFSLLGTFDVFADTREIYDLWTKFESNDPELDINFKIAKDIDKIEAVKQLLTYNYHGEYVRDLNEWIDGAKKEIKTEIGGRILDYFLDFQNSRS